MSRSIQILAPGTHSTIQDLGRPGHRAQGVASGGAVDPISLRIANLLVGNDEHAAGIECALVGPTIRFMADCKIALCGARSQAMPPVKTLRVRAKQSIAIGPLHECAFAYLAISGGIDVPRVLGSRSTDTRVGIGGFEGRRLVRGDEVPLGKRSDVGPARTRQVDLRSFHCFEAPIRILDGPDAARVSPHWSNALFHVSPRSDRMGLRLDRARIALDGKTAIDSAIIFPGAIQLPPGGEPIVLLADAQTLGGYPQIAHVITADLPRIAQRRPGSTVTFERVTLQAAHAAARKQDRDLAFLRYALSL